MQLFVVNVLISMLWALLTGKVSVGSLTLGFVLGYFALTLLYPAEEEKKNSYFQKTMQVVRFALFFTKELVVSSWRVAIDVIKPLPLMRPGVIGIPIDAETDLEITMLANIISLTPGTLSLDVSKDRKTLYIHAMYVANPDDLRKEIKDGLERRLLELLR
ncbi:Na+/H+ antiporter subunit E [Pontiella sulfatireligans]|uniref:Na(+)/H(+) antiporter subunit E n=1 Tax=Pontiella sulfatireligans TaxID=2750658 RepID=A0A6C2UQF0_9BACT|nr:Na+/H+ antiporter subunit E [Pontiella sulfatireligans]VGO22515.1 Na(+)/H(+) antiporter subunit E [Pontiella sulfatireligans]